MIAMDKGLFYMTLIRILAYPAASRGYITDGVSKGEKR